MDIETTIVDIIKETTGIDEIDLDGNLMDDLDLSSLEILTMFSDIEEAFKIKIPTAEIETITCVRDIINIVKEKIG